MPGSTGPGTPSDTPQTGTTEPVSAAGAIDVCAVVTAADVAPLFSGAVTATAEQGLTGTASGCSYASTQTGEGIAMEVVTGDAASTYWSGNTPPSGNADTIPVAGIGDKAMRAPDGPDFVSIKGSVFCEIEDGSENPATFNGLPTPDANNTWAADAATAFAQKVGSLCNKVFASQ